MSRWVILGAFLIGVTAGVGGALYAPRWWASYLPAGLGRKTELIEGEVRRKLKEADRLLLTVLTPDGVVLATFKRRVAEIEVLVQEGDLITLALGRYEPFVENPEITRVRESRAAAGGARREPRPEPTAPPAAQPQAAPPAR
jgi:hypothetical protein